MGTRDDFSTEIKNALARRVGLLCSNPECRALTAGPQSDPAKAVSIGVAAHITAASEGGPRYDPALSTDGRASATNGIWLCQNCAKRIDSDVARYSTALLYEWKLKAESLADHSLGKPGALEKLIARPSTPKERAVAAIAANGPQAEGAVRSFMEWLSKELDPLARTLRTQGQPTYELFSAGIEAARPLVHDFHAVAVTVAEFVPEMAPRLLKGFEGILKQYESSGPEVVWPTSFDVAKFVGHELFLVFVGCVSRFERWNELADSLGQTLFRNGGPATYSNILDDIPLAKGIDPSQQWISAHGEVLRRRYDSGMPVTFSEIADADYLVHLITGIVRRSREFWFPVTAVYLKGAPDWLNRCQSAAHLRAMLRLFGAADIEEFRARFDQVRLPKVRNAFQLQYLIPKPEAMGRYA